MNSLPIEPTCDQDGFILLAGPYTIGEITMMTPVIDDLRRGGIIYRTKDTEAGTEIWREKRGCKFTEDEQ